MTPLTSQILCLSSDPLRGGLIREAILTAIPSANVEMIAERLSPTDQRRAAPCIVIDANIGNEAGVDVLRQMRGAGFGGEAILIFAEPSPALAAKAVTVGVTRTLLFNDVAREIPAALEAARVIVEGNDTTSAAYRELRRVQQLVAAGEIAARIQHDINNPLTALLAETQLLEMEELNDDVRASVSRMIDLCRRVIVLVRKLDGVPRPTL